MIERILTIGAYGFDGPKFIAALTGAGADLFIDIRARRGVRGAEYAFANAKRLQASLEAAEIRYVHAKELAPGSAVRQAQYAADAAAGVRKRDRSRLGEAFIKAYRDQCLANFEARRFVEEYCGGSQRPVLFCVEREAAACHRSLVAQRLAADLKVPVEDLRP